MLEMDRFLLDNADNIQRVPKSPVIRWAGDIKDYQRICQCLWQHWLRFHGDRPQDPFVSEHPHVYNMHPEEDLCLNKEYLTLDPEAWVKEHRKEA